MREIRKTEDFPTRYLAFDNPGDWAVYTGELGQHRSRNMATHLSRAVLHVPEQNGHWPELVDGGYVDVIETAEDWRSDVWPAYVAECHYTAPNRGRAQQGARISAQTLEGAMAKGEAWLEKVRASLRAEAEAFR